MGSCERYFVRAAAHLCNNSPLSHDLVLHHVAGPVPDTVALPQRVLLLCPDPNNSFRDELFIDKVPLPRDSWSYDSHDRILIWRGVSGGGKLHLSHDGHGGHGVVGDPLQPTTVQVGTTVTFLCDVASNCGAEYTTSGGLETGITWDVNSSAWGSATWTPQRLLLTYTVTPGGPFGPGAFTFTFQDQITGTAWSPDMPGSATASLNLIQPGDRAVWSLNFRSTAAAPQDSPTTNPDTVYPWWLQAVEDLGVTSINGVMEIDKSNAGPLLGIQGKRQSTQSAGYYRAAGAAAPIGIFDGKLDIAGHPVAGSRLTDNRVTWTGLTSEQQRQSGLPANGTLIFQDDGSAASMMDSALQLARLSAVQATDLLSTCSGVHPVLLGNLVTTIASLAETAPTISGLLGMTPFLRNADGSWSDVVQTAVMQGMSAIMSSAIPSDMWSLVYPNTPQPVLSGELAIIASSPVDGVPDPMAFYHQLGIAVMSQGLAGGSDAACKFLNQPRATAWLKTQVASSKVYYRHSQLLFQYQWRQQFGLINTYLDDQQNNAATYTPMIASQLAAAIADINNNVAADPTQPNLIADLIAEVTDAAKHATDDSLFWAYAFYTYNTSSGMLANIYQQISQGGSVDGTTLTRQFQQNVTVLTALDPSGYFAKKYTLTTNTFLATNILVSMYGCDTDADTFSLIKQYLQAFVTAHLDNPDPQIAAAVASIQQIMQDEEADSILYASIAALQGIADAAQELAALPYIGTSFVAWFSDKYPKFSAGAEYFGCAVVGGLAAFSTMNLILQFKSWGKMTDEEKASAVTSAVQLGIQLLAAMVKRGIRIAKVFTVEGLTAGQRSASVFKIIATGEGGELENGLVRTGNATARWLSSAEGTAKIDVSVDGVVNCVLVNDAEAVAEDASLVGKLLGKNLDEFVSTRIGPVFILAGIGFSIYLIAEGDAGAALAGDVLGIVSGALSLFAMVGTWAVEGGLIAAESFLAPMITIAGPLAIVAALAGVGVMIYEMLHQKPPPDPIQEFVDQYASGAGFSVSNTCRSIDYVTVYANPDADGLLMIGTVLNTGSGAFSCGVGGAITLVSPATSLPDCVWQVTTDGLGLSRFIAVAPSATDGSPVALYLTLMSDGSICFASKIPVSATPPSSTAVVSSAVANSATAQTQTWLATPAGDASLTSDGKHLASIPLTIQPVLPDSNGNYAPSQAQGGLAVANGTAVNAGTPTNLTLVMSGMAPNFMAMKDISLNSGNIPSDTYAPHFGVMPSTSSTLNAAITFVLNLPPPPFLSFDPSDGAISGNGGTASDLTQQNTITATNRFGSASANFSITVAPTPA